MLFLFYFNFFSDILLEGLSFSFFYYFIIINSSIVVLKKFVVNSVSLFKHIFIQNDSSHLRVINRASSSCRCLFYLVQIVVIFLFSCISRNCCNRSFPVLERLRFVVHLNLILTLRQCKSFL